MGQPRVTLLGPNDTRYDPDCQGLSARRSSTTREKKYVADLKLDKQTVAKQGMIQKGATVLLILSAGQTTRNPYVDRDPDGIVTQCRGQVTSVRGYDQRNIIVKTTKQPVNSDEVEDVIELA